MARHFESLRFLVADDDPVVRRALARELRSKGIREPVTCGEVEEALRQATSGNIDIAIVDLNFTPAGREGLELISKIHERAPGVCIVVLSVENDTQFIVDAIRRGAHEYIVKEHGSLSEQLDFTFSRIRRRRDLERLERLEEHDRERRRNIRWVGRSKFTTDLPSIIQNAHSKKVRTFIIVGETGTGKEEVAKHICALDETQAARARPCITIECGTLGSKEGTRGGELFGVEGRSGLPNVPAKGREGTFELADGSYVRLDDFQHFPDYLFPALLRVLEHNEVTRVGASRPVSVSYKLIVTCQRSLERMHSEGLLPMEIRTRLEGEAITITVPPLRERVEDVEPLVSHFLESFSPNTNVTKCSAEVMEQLQRLPYPGNVRELRNLVWALSIREKNEETRTISMTTFDEYFEQAAISVTERSTALEPNSLRAVVERAERDYLASALKRFHGNVAMVAEALGVNHNTIRRKCDLYDLPYGQGYEK